MSGIAFVNFTVKRSIFFNFFFAIPFEVTNLRSTGTHRSTPVAVRVQLREVSELEKLDESHYGENNGHRTFVNVEKKELEKVFPKEVYSHRSTSKQTIRPTLSFNPSRGFRHGA